MSTPDKYTRVTKEEFQAMRAIVESVFDEQIMWNGLNSVETQKRDVAPDRPIEIMDEQEADLALDDETVAAVEADIEGDMATSPAPAPPLVDTGLEDAADFGSGSDAAIAADIHDGDEDESTAESVINMTVQMAIFKGIRDVADEFSKSFDIDKFALLARFQKYLLNPENLENASASVVQLIKSKKGQQQEQEREQLIQQSRKDDE